MERRKFLKGAGTAGLVGGVAAATGLPTPAISQNRLQWNLQMTWPANAPLLASAPANLAAFVEKTSGGRLTIKVHAAGEIAGAFQALDAVADGAVEMGHGYPAYWAGKLPAINFLSPIPFGITTQEQNAWFRYGGGLELAQKIYSQLGVMFFPCGNTSVQGAGWFNKKLDTMGAFQGLKVRSGGMGAKVLQAVGATPVQMPLGEVPQAMQTGAIDGADFVGPFNDVAFGLHKVSKYYYWPGWMEPCGVLDCFINMAAWEGLPDDLKEIVKGGCEMANSINISEYVAKNAQAMDVIKATPGLSVEFFPDEVLKGLGTATNDVVTAAGKADALSTEAYNSIMSFRKMVLPYTNISEMRFMEARNLGFPYGGAL